MRYSNDEERAAAKRAAKITTGTFTSSDRIPTLPSSKIDPSTTFAKSMINTAAEWPLADIPNLPATKITSGSLDGARIPNLDAAKISTDGRAGREWVTRHTLATRRRSSSECGLCGVYHTHRCTLSI